MKQCPICQSLAFDDAARCYGCLHEFADDPGAPGLASAPVQALAADGTLPAFVIQVKPERERSGLVSWTCTVDLAPTQAT